MGGGGGWGWGSSAPSASSAPDAAVEGGGGRSATRRVVTSTCRTEEVDGRLIRKCDKTDKLLRECVGRPVEVVESSTEHTEEDVTDQMTDHSFSFESTAGNDIFSFPGLRSDLEAIQRSMQGNLSHFLQMAEEMKDEFVGSFGVPPHHGQDPLPRVPNRQVRKEGSVDGGIGGGDSGYVDLPGQLRDV